MQLRLCAFSLSRDSRDSPDSIHYSFATRGSGDAIVQRENCQLVLSASPFGRASIFGVSAASLPRLFIHFAFILSKRNELH